MRIKVFGPGCAKCEETARIIANAVKEAGIDAQVEKVTDFKEMMLNGIMSTPAVAIDGKIVCRGQVPAREEVLEWFGKAPN